FGAPFMPSHPMVYADLLMQKMAEHGSTAWLLNTGWSGGAYGTGSRISIKHTRALLNAALNGALAGGDFVVHPVFGVEVPTSCPGVPSEILNPKATWADAAAYDKTSQHLAQLFASNFVQFASGCSARVCEAGPRVD
ncbi:MAG: phosphoenolpyruvate carboxykinase (ATP), partial [Myxococcales bacterium]|nr:phosphoenolpyruvate carboxykinase (ATP) [Myxococcales bacterium]